MTKPKITLAMTLLLTLLTTVSSLPVSASPGPTRHLAACQTITPAKAGQIAGKKYGGKVIDVRTVKGAGGVIYRVKLLLSSGRIITVNVDAQNGRLLQ